MNNPTPKRKLEPAGYGIFDKDGTMHGQPHKTYKDAAPYAIIICRFLPVSIYKLYRERIGKGGK